jgi:hypothetical protein
MTFVKVKHESQAVLVHERLQRKQQQWKSEIPDFQGVPSVIIYINSMQRMQLSVDRANSIISCVLCTKICILFVQN